MTYFSSNYQDMKKQRPPFIKRFGHIFIYLIILVTAISFRFSGLDEESLFMDEIYQVSSYSFPLSKMVDGAARQQQPPLDYYIGHFIFLFNNSDVAARLPAALFGTGSIILLLILLLKNTNLPIAVFCSMFYALSPFHIYYSQEARPYSIAIFLLLLLIKTIIWLEEKENYTLLHFLILCLVEFLFLLSRLLSPLCLFTMLNLFFLFRAWNALLKKDKKIIKRNILYLSSAFMAFFLYLPFLFKLYESTQRYMNRSSSNNLIQSGITNFTFKPGFEAFITQFEPFGWIALTLFLISLTFLAHSLMGKRKKRHFTIFFLSAYLVISVLSLHLFVFLGTTTSPFRPAYAIYIQPLVIILIGYAILKLYKLTLHRNLWVLFGIIILTLELNAAVTSKSITHRTEWKQVINYINRNLGSNFLTIFDSLSLRNSWKPYNFGMIRYNMPYPSLSLPSLINNPYILNKLSLKPALVYFYYRDYKLLPTSPYVINPNAGGVKEIEKEKLTKNTSVKIKYFTGLIVFELSNPTGNTLQDTYYLIREAVKILPSNATLIDSLLLAHEIESICPIIRKQSYGPLKLAKQLAQQNDWPIIKKIEQKSTQLKSI